MEGHSHIYMHISGKTFGGLKINIDLWGEWVGKVK